MDSDSHLIADLRQLALKFELEYYLDESNAITKLLTIYSKDIIIDVSIGENGTQIDKVVLHDACHIKSLHNSLSQALISKNFSSLNRALQCLVDIEKLGLTKAHFKPFTMMKMLESSILLLNQTENGHSLKEKLCQGHGCYNDTYFLPSLLYWMNGADSDTINSPLQHQSSQMEQKQNLYYIHFNLEGGKRNHVFPNDKVTAYLTADPSLFKDVPHKNWKSSSLTKEPLYAWTPSPETSLMTKCTFIAKLDPPIMVTADTLNKHLKNNGEPNLMTNTLSAVIAEVKQKLHIEAIYKVCKLGVQCMRRPNFEWKTIYSFSIHHPQELYTKMMMLRKDLIMFHIWEQKNTSLDAGSNLDKNDSKQVIITVEKETDFDTINGINIISEKYLFFVSDICGQNLGQMELMIVNNNTTLNSLTGLYQSIAHLLKSPYCIDTICYLIQQHIYQTDQPH